MGNLLISNETVSGTLTVSGVSVETWRKIVEFIEREIAGGGEVARTEVGQTVETEEKSIGEIFAEPLPPLELTFKPEEEPKRGGQGNHGDRFRSLPGYREISEEIAKAKNTNGTEWMWQTAKEFAASIPSIKKIDTKCVGRILSGMCRNGDIEVRTKVGEANVYRLPVILSAGQRFGKSLAAIRTAHTLTVDDVAELIGYPSNLVRGWENGTLAITPETDGYKNLVKLFGRTEWNKYFAG